MADKVKKKKPAGPKVRDVMIPGQGGARLIDQLTDELRKALGWTGNAKPGTPKKN